MTREPNDSRVRLDLNDAGFQEDLLGLPKPERHSAMETLAKLRRMTWGQVYQDHGLKWEKIANAEPPPGASGVYSLRITQSRRATAYRKGEFICFLTIPPDHDATYRKK